MNPISFVGIHEFQYSFCSYSTPARRVRCVQKGVSIQLLFLFNFLPRTEWVDKKEFQYSFCSYSTYFHIDHELLHRVSIQLLFLFNETWQENEEKKEYRFNTASVLIQPSILLQLLFIGYTKTFEKSSFFSFFPTSIPFLSI